MRARKPLAFLGRCESSAWDIEMPEPRRLTVSGEPGMAESGKEMSRRQTGGRSGAENKYHRETARASRICIECQSELNPAIQELNQNSAEDVGVGLRIWAVSCTSRILRTRVSVEKGLLRRMASLPRLAFSRTAASGYPDMEITENPVRFLRSFSTNSGPP